MDPWQQVSQQRRSDRLSVYKKEKELLQKKEQVTPSVEAWFAKNEKMKKVDETRNINKVSVIASPPFSDLERITTINPHLEGQTSFADVLKKTPVVVTTLTPEVEEVASNVISKKKKEQWPELPSGKRTDRVFYGPKTRLSTALEDGCDLKQVASIIQEDVRRTASTLSEKKIIREDSYFSLPKRPSPLSAARRLRRRKQQQQQQQQESVNGDDAADVVEVVASADDCTPSPLNVDDGSKKKKSRESSPPSSTTASPIVKRKKFTFQQLATEIKRGQTASPLLIGSKRKFKRIKSQRSSTPDNDGSSDPHRLSAIPSSVEQIDLSSSTVSLHRVNENLPDDDVQSPMEVIDDPPTMDDVIVDNVDDDVVAIVDGDGNRPRPRTFKMAIRLGNLIGQAETLIAQHSVGVLDVVCSTVGCSARYFTNEKTTRQSCCKMGKVVIPVNGGQCPDILYDLLTERDPRLARQFRENIRLINSLFAMATFTCHIPVGTNPLAEQGQCFTISGQIYHYVYDIPFDADRRQGATSANITLRNNQYYFIDADEAIRRRSNFVENRVSDRILADIERMLRQVNPFVRAYVTMSELIRRRQPDPLQNIVIGFREDMRRMLRTHNLPDVGRSEIAAVFQGDPPFDVDLTVYPRLADQQQQQQPTNRHHELRILNKFTDPMVYPILFPHGELGHDFKQRQAVGNRNVTFRQFYRQKIHMRRPTVDERGREHFSILHNSGKLFQQYIVDCYVKVENSEMWYLRKNCLMTRHATYQAIVRMMEARARDEKLKVGTIQLLPASFKGGFRHQNRLYLDAMNIITRHGKPDLFVTFTCNPYWPEIQESLYYCQQWVNRPDLICRVFHSKLIDFLDQVVRRKVYGFIKNYFYTIEFQKSGLPHAHILFTFEPEDKLNCAERVDAIIQAQIPDPLVEPVLYEIVKKSYLHTKCGDDDDAAAAAQCINKDGECSKGYPKPYSEVTLVNVNDDEMTLGDGRPLYARPNNGRTINANNDVYTNSDVVPYNRYAALLYRCHINFEAVGSLASVRYLYKYLIAKGTDIIDLERVDAINNSATPYRNNGLLHYDEIKHYQEMRYVSSVEACWRLFEYKLSDRSHSVQLLPIHLEDRQNIVYDEAEEDEALLARLDLATKLTAYFELNRHDEGARAIHYVNIPEHYVWNRRNARWDRRRASRKIIGALFEVSASGNEELYCLRLLLQHVTGATSFLDLRTIKGRPRRQQIVYETFRETCQHLGLLRTDDFYNYAMNEAIVRCQSPYTLRKFFATIIVQLLVVADFKHTILPLWNAYKDPHMIGDFCDALAHHGDDDGERRKISLALALQHIRTIYVVQSNNRDVVVSLEDICLADVEIEDVHEHTLREAYRYLVAWQRQRDVLSQDFIDCFLIHDAEFTRVAHLNEQFVQTHSVDLLTPDQRKIYNVFMGNLLRSRNLVRNREVVVHFQLMEYFRYDLGIVDDQFYHGFIDDDYDGFRWNDESQSTTFDLLHFVDGPGGSGKTFLYNVIVSKLLQRREMHNLSVLVVAWTGIAASLIRGGQTVHGAFNLPLELREGSRAGWDVEHPRSLAMARVDAILFDEVSMANRHALDAIDLFLRDITGMSAIPFGNKAVLFGGDFRQILPIVVNADKVEIIQHTVKRSPLWRHVTCHQLVVNLRIVNNGQAFADWLLRVGNGVEPHKTVEKAPYADLIEIPPELCLDDCNALIEWVYNGDGGGDVLDINQLEASLHERVILSPTNSSVSTINERILSMLPGDSQTYFSVDRSLGSVGDQFHVSDDVLHATEPSKLPPHRLTLKVGAVVLLLRNLDVTEGHCNGCRYIVRALYEHCVVLESITNIHTNRPTGRILWLPKVIMTSSTAELPRPMERIQFPIRLAFAMTVNKGQGQTFKRLGIYLPNPCFSHGQLYVAFSRVGNPNQVRCVIDNTAQQGQLNIGNGDVRLTRNVVYQELFACLPDNPKLIRSLFLVREERRREALFDRELDRFERDPTPPGFADLDFDRLTNIVINATNNNSPNLVFSLSTTDDDDDEPTVRHSSFPVKVRGKSATTKPLISSFSSSSMSSYRTALNVTPSATPSTFTNFFSASFSATIVSSDEEMCKSYLPVYRDERAIPVPSTSRGLPPKAILPYYSRPNIYSRSNRSEQDNSDSD